MTRIEGGCDGLCASDGDIWRHSYGQTLHITSNDSIIFKIHLAPQPLCLPHLYLSHRVISVIIYLSCLYSFCMPHYWSAPFFWQDGNTVLALAAKLTLTRVFPWAVQHCNIDVSKALLKAGASINHVNKVATIEKYAKIVVVLLHMWRIKVIELYLEIFRRFPFDAHVMYTRNTNDQAL